MDYIISKFYEYGYKVTYNKYTGTYNSCCPICREGKSWGRKKRCFFIPGNDNIYCHNCGSSLKPYQWIREVSGMSHDELEEDLEGEVYDVRNDVVPNETPVEVPTLPEDSINLFDPIQVDFYRENLKIKAAIQYIHSRRLDTAINRPDALYISLNDKFQGNRLVIPFKNEEGKIVFYQTRKIFDWDDGPSYLSKPNSDKTLFGIDKINPDKDTVFLFEGPLDSFFVKNAIGVAGINKGNFRFTTTQQEQLQSLMMFRKIWVLDNQWVDETARVKTFQLLDMGECVFIWPKDKKEYKDFNEMCISYGIDGISSSYITQNSQCGPSAVYKCKLLFGKLYLSMGST